MKRLLAYAAKIVFYVFVAAVLGWTCSLTVQLVQRVLPDSGVTPFFALALFDGGAITWLLVFLSYASGTPQRSISLVMIIIDLVGVVAMSVAELFLGGQTYAEVPTYLGTLVIWGIGLATLANVISSYAFHVTNPTARREIETQTMRDELKERSIEIARSNMERNAQAIASHLGADIEEGVLLDLGVGDIFKPTRIAPGRPLAPNEVSPELAEFAGIVRNAAAQPPDIADQPQPPDDNHKTAAPFRPAVAGQKPNFTPPAQPGSENQ